MTLGSTIINELAVDISGQDFPLLQYCTYVISNSAGALTLVVFLLDPGFLSALGSDPYSEYETKTKSGLIQALTSNQPGRLSTSSSSICSSDPEALNIYLKCKRLL